VSATIPPFTQEHQSLRESLRSFVEKEIRPHAPEWEEAQEFPRELFNRMGKLGFLGLNYPEEYGGQGGDDLHGAVFAEEMARCGSGGVAAGIGGHVGIAMPPILKFGTDDQKRRWLVPGIKGEQIGALAITEPGAGSDAANIKLSARQDGDDWVLNGEKTFITNGNDADFAIVVAVTDREKGVRGGGTTAFLVDRSMGWRSEFIQTMGEGGPASLIFDDVRVPSRNILGEIGQGFELGMKWIGKGRYLIPSNAIGIAERALGMAIEHANTRETFGRPIGTNQAIQWMLADSETELEAARWLILRAAWTVDQGEDPRHSSSMAKLYGAGMVNRVVDRVMQIHGGMGYTRELPIERWYRQVRLMRIYEGTDEMQRLIISRDLLRGYTKIGGHLA
jgi:acyl-CoA dehydrogenase